MWINLESCASNKWTVHNLNVVCKPLSPREPAKRIYMILYMWLCISIYLYEDSYMYVYIYNIYCRYMYIYIVYSATDKKWFPFTMAGLTVKNLRPIPLKRLQVTINAWNRQGAFKKGRGNIELEPSVGFFDIFCLHKVLLKDVSSRKRDDLSVFMLWLTKCIFKQKTTLLEELGNYFHLFSTDQHSRLFLPDENPTQQLPAPGWDSHSKLTNKWCTTPKINMEAGN